MPRVIALASPKGGVGKTTSVLNLGVGLGRLGARVLLVDADPQGGLANACSLKTKTQAGLVDVLRGTLPIEDAVVAARNVRLAVLGTGVCAVEDIEVIEAAAAAGDLERVVASIAPAYDYALLDAPGGIGTLVRGVLRASDAVVVPVNCRSLAVRSMPTFLKTLADVEAHGAKVRLEGVLVTMFNVADAIERQLHAELRAKLPKEAMFTTVIPADASVEVASAEAVPVALATDGGRAARAYLQLALELRARELERTATEANGGQAGVGLF